MKVAIMQPYFFPYLGYWQVMNAADRYVVYDDVNFIKGGRVNRNAILMNGQAHNIKRKENKEKRPSRPLFFVFITACSSWYSER